VELSARSHRRNGQVGGAVVTVTGFSFWLTLNALSLHCACV
jgi:hypothetical protein